MEQNDHGGKEQPMSKLMKCTCGIKPEVWEEDSIVWVQCPSCFRQMPGETLEQAGDKWNEMIREEKKK